MATDTTKESNYTLPIVLTIAASFVVVCALIALLIITNHDPGTFLNAIIALVGLLPSIGVIGYAVNQTAKKTDTVVKNTNGNLSKLQQQISALTAVATPDQIAAANGALSALNTLPVSVPAATTAIATAPAAPTPEPAIAAVPTPAQIHDLLIPATPVTPVNVTSGGNS